MSQTSACLPQPPRLIAAIYCAAAICALCQSVAAGQSKPGDVGDSRAADPGVPRQKKITISKQTTHLAEPLDAAGFVDYVGAINTIHSYGVMPENNAAILIWKAIGPSSLPPDRRDWFYRSIGMDPLPEEGEYFRPVPSGMTASGGATFQFLHRVDERRFRPWAESDDPELASWLEENTTALKLVIQASGRLRYFSPRWADEIELGREQVNSLTHPDLDMLRRLVPALLARSMLRLGKGEVDLSRQDQLACHRLASLISQETDGLTLLVAHSFNARACDAEQALAHFGNLTVEQARQFERDIRELTPATEIATSIDTYERWKMLDAATWIAAIALADVNDAKSEQVAKAIARFVRMRASAFALHAEWDPVLAFVNSYCDRAVRAAQIPDLQTRIAELKGLSDEAEALEKEVRSVEFPQGDQLASRATLLLSKYVVGLTFPRMDLTAAGRGRERVRLDETRLAMALAGFHRQNGRYPAELSELVAGFGKLPGDPFSNGQLIYRQIGPGYLLYSVGENGEDDGGATYGTVPAGDDLRVYDEGQQFVTAPAPSAPSAVAPSASLTPATPSNESESPETTPSTAAPEIPIPAPPASSDTGDILAILVAASLAFGLIAWLVKRR